jgi:dTDP-4-amino-4,6-dideoxygalactose transaminase
MDLVRPFYFDLNDDEIAEFTRAAESILRSGTLILGEHTARFEREFAAFVGAAHGVTVNSGMTALEILLRIQKVEGRTVLVPTNTNFATVAAVLRAGGKVRYLDMSPETFAPTFDMVEEATRASPDVAGVMWVHIGGVISSEFPRVVSWCHERGLFVLEDAAHAHGSRLGGRAAGQLADGAAFSFFPTKVMTTFEGGMITLDDPDHAYAARSYRNQGKRGVNFGGLHEDMGMSGRMHEPSAALGYLQLRRMEQKLALRQRLFEIIAAKLDAGGVRYVSVRHMDRASHYKMIVLLPDGLATEDAKKRLADEGVLVGGAVYEIPCHLQPVFEGVVPKAPCPQAEAWCPRHVCPPLTTGMSDADAVKVGDALVRCLA